MSNVLFLTPPPLAFHQFPNRGPTFAPNANKNTPEGLVVSAPAEQPAVERYSGQSESGAHHQRDQETGGEINCLNLNSQPLKIIFVRCN